MTDKGARQEETKKSFDPAHLLASPHLAQWLLGVLVLFAMLLLLPLVIGGPGAGEAAQRFASYSLPFLGLYLVLAGSLLVCMVRRFKGVKRRVGSNARPRLHLTADSVVAPSSFDAGAAGRALRRAGYRHVSADGAWAWGVKHRWSPIGTIVLHSAVLLAIFGAALAVIPGVDRMTHVSAVPGITVESSDGVPELLMTSLDVEPGEGGTLRKLSGELRTPGGRSVRVRPDLPVLVNAFTAIVVEDYDLAPTFSVISTSALSPVYRETALLRLRKAGARDRMTVDAGKLGTYRITVRLDDGNPQIAIATTERRLKRGRWRLIDSQRTLKRGEMVQLDKIRLRFEGLRPYAVLRVHRAPSGPFITIALLAAMFGAGMRLLFPRTEATIADVEGSTAVTVIADVYKGSRSASAALALAFEEEEGR